MLFKNTISVETPFDWWQAAHHRGGRQPTTVGGWPATGGKVPNIRSTFTLQRISWKHYVGLLATGGRLPTTAVVASPLCVSRLILDI